MSAMRTDDGRHRTQVVSWHGPKLPTVLPGEFVSRIFYAARCTCGWVGHGDGIRSDAEEDADEHVRIMAGE
jgi:hypothetical protein